MGGEIIYQVTAAEVGEIKKDPSVLAGFKPDSRESIDLGVSGYPIDIVLDYLNDDIGVAELCLAVSCDKDVGSDEFHAKTLNSKQVRAASAAMDKITRSAFKDAFETTHAGSDEAAGDELYELFDDIRDFFKRAVKKRRSLVKTIY